MLWPKMCPQKAVCAGSFVLSVSVPQGCIEHSREQPGLTGPRVSSRPSPCWEQQEQSPGCRGCTGRTCTLRCRASPTPHARGASSCSSQSPLGGRGPRVLHQWVPCLAAALMWGCPGGAAVGRGCPELLYGQGSACAGHPARHFPAEVLPAHGCSVAPSGWDDSHLPVLHGKTAGSHQTLLLWAPVRSPQFSCLTPAAKPPTFPLPTCTRS